MKIKTSKYMNINRIEFVVTYQCPGRCKHCQVGDSFQDRGNFPHVDISKSTEAVKKLSELFPVTSVMTFGGEPLLYPEAVYAIHQCAADCRIETRQLITSGYFSEDPENIKAVAEGLAEAGVNNLLLSVDAFHQETIPAEPVRCFAKEVYRVGIPGAYLYSAWVVDKNHPNPYNEKTRDILNAFADTGLPLRDNIVNLTGNAAVYLAEYYDKSEPNLTEACDSLGNVKELCIEPSGNVTICGFIIGNLYSEDITEIVSRYNPYQSTYMRAVLTGGPAALLDCAGQNGISIDTSKLCTDCGVCLAVGEKLPCQF
jgi:MoaA/NifB/PqqE/SkfB family radical SAM enzyme